MLALRKRSLGLCLAAAAVIALSASASARGDTVTDWNVHAVNALVGTAGQSPTVSTVHLAMVHGAVYDAVNSIDERYEPYLVEVRARDWYSKDAAAATAAYRVLLGIVPGAAGHAGAALRGVAGVDPGRPGEGGRRSSSARSPRRRCWPRARATAAAAPTASRRRRLPDPWPVGQWRPVLPAFGNDPSAWIKDVRPFLIRDPARYAHRRPATRSPAGATRASSTRSRPSAR